MKDTNKRGAKYPEASEPKEAPVPIELILQGQIKYLQGKILTIIDASYTDSRQLKAVKDLVNDSFGTQLDWILQLAFPHK